MYLVVLLGMAAIGALIYLLVQLLKLEKGAGKRALPNRVVAAMLVAQCLGWLYIAALALHVNQ